MRHAQLKRLGMRPLQMGRRFSSMACLIIVPVLLAGCVKHRKFDYALAETQFSSWKIGAFLGSAESGKLQGGPLVFARHRGAPYSFVISLRGVESTTVVKFENAVLTSVADGSGFPVVLGPVNWWNEEVRAGNLGVDLPYEDYVLTVRVILETDSVVAEHDIQLTLVRAYSEERVGLLSDFMVGF